jgi:hypothetical protein
MLGALTPLRGTPSWRGAQLKKAQGQLHVFTFYFTVQLGEE